MDDTLEPVGCLPGRDQHLAQARWWRQTLLGGPIHYFPIRHHSPACARHLTAWMRQYRPESIVVEGPCSLDRWLSLLARDDCRAPVAMLTSCRAPADADAHWHSALYPLCDYSPEWVAIRQGQAMGARLRFADLEFTDQQRLPPDDLGTSRQGLLLTDESHLRHSRFIATLVRRLGCRDFDELWDHLFESQGEGMDTGDFVGLLATYCDLSRAGYDAAHLQADATLAREAAMARVIREEFRRLERPRRQGALLVVSGGFHTVALPERVAAGGPDDPPSDTTPPESWLIRYSYDQLDALAGYRAGMPSPGFYHALWQAGPQPPARRRVLAGLITGIARDTRGKPVPYEASVSDAIAAVEMMAALADLRGHPTPTRDDLRDAVISCLGKESTARDGTLTALMTRALAGHQVGEVPAAAGKPPIVDDFQRLASDYRLPMDTIEPRTLSLDLYRKPAHRAISFFLHQLSLLEIPYATFRDGPDFAIGHGLDKRREEWTVAWTPITELRLTEQATRGHAVAAAAARQVLERMRRLQDEGAARSADQAVDLLIRACRCGLHPQAEGLMGLVRTHIAEDGVFASVTGALSRLVLLHTAREPLEATRLPGLGEALGQCYRRATFLIHTLATVPDDQVDGSLDGLLSLRELLNDAQLGEDDPTAGREPLPPLDSSLFTAALERLLQPTGPPPRSEFAGAAAGLLHGAGRLDPGQLWAIVRHYLDAAVEDIDGACGVVRGLMATTREAFWRQDELMAGIDGLFRDWDDSRFYAALPHLRLAFSQLSPREVDTVAGRVAGLHRVRSIGPLIHPDISEDDLHLGVVVSQLMNRSLQEDGLP